MQPPKIAQSFPGIQTISPRLLHPPRPSRRAESRKARREELSEPSWEVPQVAQVGRPEGGKSGGSSTQQKWQKNDRFEGFFGAGFKLSLPQTNLMVGVLLGVGILVFSTWTWRFGSFDLLHFGRGFLRLKSFPAAYSFREWTNPSPPWNCVLKPSNLSRNIWRLTRK